MEQATGSTPHKVHMRYENALSYSPRLYKTPGKQKEFKHNEATHSSAIESFTLLPNHMTPPSGLTKFMARNPFEPDLTNRLHLSVMSPTVFSKISSPSSDSPNFAWSIDELALIQPALIEELPGQQIHHVDPEVEVKAQAAINKFFDANEIIPSPWEIKRKENRSPSEMCTPVKTIDNSILPKDPVASKKEGWSQTTLSLPPELPPEVEEALKPYFTFTQEQNADADDANLSNSSLRRKLFFNHDDCLEHEDEESSISLSPDKANTSLVLICSPPQSGMFTHGTPFKKSSKRFQEIDGTPRTNFENLSPPNMSPISHGICEMSYENIKPRSLSATRLDFTTDMSFEHYENRTCRHDNEDTSTKMLINESNIKIACGSVKLAEDSSHRKKLIDIERNLDSSLTCSKSNEKDIGNGALSSQDTGYHTYSTSNIVNVTESYKISPIKDKLQENNRVLNSVDGTSDWEENIKNVFSSTPSRFNRQRVLGKGNSIKRS